MKIIAYINDCQRSNDVRSILKKYNLRYEEYQTVGASARQDSPIRLVVNGVTLEDVSGKSVEDYLLEQGIVQQVDEKSKAAISIDEEQESIRSKTTRFF